MPTISLKQPDGSSISVGVTLDEVLDWFRRGSGSGDQYLNYDFSYIAAQYGDLPWIRAHVNGHALEVPYTLVHDYRKHPSASWGIGNIGESYHFPAQLLAHRRSMVDRFTKEGRLFKKGDSLCPRVASFDVAASDEPLFQLERAWYTDQVGTNLTLDFPLSKPITVAAIECRTAREWDQASGIGRKEGLPEFSTSRLANTIGVSIGVTCRTKTGEPALLRRSRAKNVAVYAGMWASPFAFALALPKEISDGPHNMRDIISWDLGVEFAEELALDTSEFTEPRPVAFCRDVVRGGKPQFFFEMSTDVPFEDIATRLGKKNSEYTGRVSVVDSADNASHPKVSPELACFIALHAQELSA